MNFNHAFTILATALALVTGSTANAQNAFPTNFNAGGTVSVSTTPSGLPQVEPRTVLQSTAVTPPSPPSARVELAPAMPIGGLSVTTNPSSTILSTDVVHQTPTVLPVVPTAPGSISFNQLIAPGAMPILQVGP